MENQEIGATGEKQIRRFVGYEEFLNAFYPEFAQAERAEGPEENGNFGAHLAIESLNRHAEILKFRGLIVLAPPPRAREG